MTLIKFRQPSDLFRPFDRTFEEMVDEFFNFNPWFTRTNNFGAVNVKETDASYVLEVLLPGFSKDEVNVEIEDETLTISAKVENSTSSNNDGYTRKEFMKKSFMRSFTIPENVDVDKISADMKDGILNIVLNKKQVEEKKPNKRKIF